MLNKATPPPLPKNVDRGNQNAEENYGIIDWFKKSLKNYVNFSGRARRKEFWYFFLVQTGLTILAMIVDSIIFSSETGIFYAIVALSLFLPSIAVGIRRLHDTGRSGWWILISLVPLIGGIVFLVFCASDTTPEVNQWGPPAK